MKPLRLLALILLIVIIVPLAGLSACGRKLLYFPQNETVAPTLPGVTAERIETQDGERLIAWYAAPQSDAQPIFLYFDGNAGAPERWDIRWRTIREHGAGFLAVYYRGYSGSTGSPTEEGLHQDARAGYDWLIANGYDADDIVIHGLSLGTGVATKLASERPARALVLEAPFSAAVDIASERYPFLPVRTIMKDQFRSRDWIADVNMPVLIVHGDADRTIPVEHGERLFGLAREPKRFIRVPGGGHTSLVRDGLYDHVWAFLAEHPAQD